MTQYFRVTVYEPRDNLSAVMDSNGRYEKLWQFSSYLLGRGFKILEASGREKFLDGNIGKAEPDPAHILLRAYCKGKPVGVSKEIDGVVYRAVQIGDSVYIPDRSQTGGAV
jgi:hypothetical protein